MIRILQLTTIALLCTGLNSWAQCSFIITPVVTNVSCYNGTTGSIVVNVSGGTAPYQYQLAEAGAGAWQSSNTFTSLVANNYPVSVKDATGCTKTVYVTVNQPANLVTTYTDNDATCNNSADGSITTNTTGGTAPYSYSWTKNGTAYATTANISNLTPANYLLTVTDAKGCTTIPVVASSVVPVSLTGFNQDVIANGTGQSASSTTQPLDDHSYVFYASGYKISTSAGTGSSGLPSSGSFTSAQNSSRTYQLASYTSNNSLVLSSSVNYGSATSGTLSFAAQHQSPYSTLYVVGTTGNGTGTVNYSVKFSDNSTTTGSLTFPDWFLDPATASTQRALGGLDRVSWASTGSSYASSTSFNLFEAPINIPVANQGTAITSVTFTWSSAGSARVNLFAITGNTSTTSGIRINDGPASNVTPSVSVASDAPSNTFCSGQFVTFTATPTNGGNSPTYQWYKNSGTIISGATSASYTTNSLSASDKIYVVMTSSLSCVSATTATATKVTMTSGTVPASVTAAASATSVCSGSPTTFTATPTNGGTTPTYQWYKNNVAITGATSSTYSATDISNLDNIKVMMTSSIACATNSPSTSNIIPMVVTASGEPTIVIAAAPAVTFTSVTAFGGTSPTYEWYKNGTIISGATGPTYSTTTASVTDIFSVKMTSNYACKTAPAAKSNYINIINSMLPVTLQSYVSGVDNNKVTLKWKTSKEQFSKQFIIQRATGAGGFSAIGKVAARNSNFGSEYEYVDQPALAGTYQYRLTLEDLDGKITYFGIKTAVIKDSDAFKVIDQNSEWKLLSDKSVKYEFMDGDGRLLEKGTFMGVKYISKPAVKGIYLLRVYSDSNVVVQKLIAR